MTGASTSGKQQQQQQQQESAVPAWLVPFHFVQSVSVGPYRAVQTGVLTLVDNLRHASLPLFGERPAPNPSQVADRAIKELAKKPMSAARLRRALTAVADNVDWRARVLETIEPWGRNIGAAGQHFQPQGPGTCDCNACERCCNVVTSLPYIATGIHSMKHRRTREGRLWGASIACVGVASTGFHASTGRWRDLGRKMDYWSIALSSNLLVRAVYPQMPLALTVTGALATPFRPFVVSMLNSLLMETKFLRRAHANKAVRPAQMIHSACCVLGLTAFLLEDLVPGIPLMHATWHCLSACAVGTTNALLDDVERHELSILHRATSAGPFRAGNGNGGSNGGSQPRVGALLGEMGRDLRDLGTGNGSFCDVVDDLERLGSLRVQRDE